MRDSRFVRTYGKIAVPKTGAFFGADDTTRGFTTALGIETQLGREMAIRNRHAGWSAFSQSGLNALLALVKGDVAAGTIPMLSIGGQGWPSTGLSEIATGALDQEIANLVQAYQAFDVGFVLRPMMEMNGAHNAAYFGNPPLYRQAFERIAFFMRKYAPDGVLVFCPQQTSSVGPDPAAWQAYEPLDYDWGGLDLYRSTLDIASTFITHYHLHGRPTIICESGFEQDVPVHDPQGVAYDKDGSVTGSSLILHTRDQIKQHPNVIGYLVWNNVGPAGTDYIDTSMKSLLQYQLFADDPYFAP